MVQFNILILHLFILDHIFDEQTDSKSVFEAFLKPKLKLLKKNLNVLAAVYGYSGTGKTYTIFGSADAPELVSFAFEHMKDEFKSSSMK